MAQYFAFLRALNVGGNHIVKMEDLRAMFAGWGFANVATYIASGNVIFQAASDETAAVEADVEARLRTALGYEVKTFIRTGAELAVIAQFTPAGGDPVAFNVMFHPAPVSAEAQEKVLALRTPVDAFHFSGRETYWLCQTKMSESKYPTASLEKLVAMPGTMRTINTVRKLVATYAPSA
jgi:uncharacterized protein (DUF1697 family)